MIQVSLVFMLDLVNHKFRFDTEILLFVYLTIKRSKQKHYPKSRAGHNSNLWMNCLMNFEGLLYKISHEKDRLWEFQLDLRVNQEWKGVTKHVKCCKSDKKSRRVTFPDRVWIKVYFSLACKEDFETLNDMLILETFRIGNQWWQ